MMRELGRLPRNVEDTGEGVVIDVRDLRMRYGSVDVLRVSSSLRGGVRCWPCSG